jgi:hypothetical protein
MSYIIISNVGMAVMMLLIYLRQTHIRLRSKKEIQKIKQVYENQISELKKAENTFDAEGLKIQAMKVEGLESQIIDLKRDRDSEEKLRINAEKQIEIANKKMQELEKRIEDWSVVQDAIMNDSRESFIKVGNDLFKKLNDSYKQEVETNRNLIGRIAKLVEEQKNLITNMAITNAQNFLNPSVNGNDNKKIIDDYGSNQNNFQNNFQNNLINQQSYSSNNQIPDDTASKKLLEEIIETMKASGRLANKDYFTSSNLDLQRAKLMLCELLFVDENAIYIIDFKGIKYFNEYEKLSISSDIQAQNFLKEKLEKYLGYLSNPKYLESISRIFESLRIPKKRISIILALTSKKQLAILKDLQYFEKAKKLNIEVMDFDLIVNIVI